MTGLEGHVTSLTFLAISYVSSTVVFFGSVVTTRPYNTCTYEESCQRELDRQKITSTTTTDADVEHERAPPRDSRTSQGVLQLLIFDRCELNGERTFVFMRSFFLSVLFSSFLFRLFIHCLTVY